MSTTTLALEDRRATRWSRLFDYVELTKPRITLMVLVTVAVAAVVAGWGPPDGWLLFNTLAGTLLVATSASALNQLLERDSDALMPRTADRPLPAGRLSTGEVATLGMVTIVAGTAYLALAVNPTTALLGLLTWAIYVWIYTPLKTRTASNTPVGAVAGALPALMGWAAVGAPLDLRAWALFLLVFIWQFPHFMAIAWIYRGQYAGAGLKMLTTVDASGQRAGAQAMVSALVLIPVSLVPCLTMPGAGIYFAWAVVLGVAQLGCAIAFFAGRSERSARRLLLASLIYLPAMLGLLVLGPLA